PPYARDVALVHDVRDVEPGDVRVEAVAKRCADLCLRVVAEELLHRVRLDAKEVVAGDGRAVPGVGPVTHAGEQRSSRAAEEAPRVDDRSIVARVVTSKPVEHPA